MLGGTAVFLVTAAIGYWVLERAQQQKKGLKTTGLIVGGLIIALSFLGFACKTYYRATGKGYCCPMKEGICPMTGKKMTQLP